MTHEPRTRSPRDTQRDAHAPGLLSRRHALVAGIMVAGAAALQNDSAWAANWVIATQAEHEKLPVVWGYPFASSAERKSGVDGYPGATYAGHNGVDYFTKPRIGTTIHAVADGIVAEVSDPLRTADSLGQSVRIRHAAGILSSYGHMTPGSTRVTPGQNVARGAPIGATGWSGRIVPATPETAQLHLSISSMYAGKTTFWNPIWLVDNAPKPAPISAEDPDMPILVQSNKGHIYTIAPRYIRHETSMADVTFLQTVYPRFVICRSDAQFRAVLASLSVPLAQADSVRSGAGGGTWAQ